MRPRGAFDDSLLRVHHVFLPGVGRISSQNIWHSYGGGIAGRNVDNVFSIFSASLTG
jgi:hypothetical protein